MSVGVFTVKSKYLYKSTDAMLMIDLKYKFVPKCSGFTKKYISVLYMLDNVP